MGEFFHGWKRKVGVWTLALTCLLTAGWLRSSLHVDAVTISGRGLGMSFVSGSEKFRVLFRRELPVNLILRLGDSGNGHVETWHLEVCDPNSWSIDRRTARGQFANVDAFCSSETAHSRLRFVPYWTIVVPLTLLSAWLLVTPRKRQDFLPSEDQQSEEMSPFA